MKKKQEHADDCIISSELYIMIYGKYNLIYPYLPYFEIGGQHPSAYNSFLTIRFTVTLTILLL